MPETPKYQVIWRTGFGVEVDRAEGPTRQAFEQRVREVVAPGHIKQGYTYPIICPAEEYAALEAFIEHEVADARLGKQPST